MRLGSFFLSTLTTTVEVISDQEYWRRATFGIFINMISMIAVLFLAIFFLMAITEIFSKGTFFQSIENYLNGSSDPCPKEDNHETSHKE